MKPIKRCEFLFTITHDNRITNGECAPNIVKGDADNVYLFDIGCPSIGEHRSDIFLL